MVTRRQAIGTTLALADSFALPASTRAASEKEEANTTVVLRVIRRGFWSATGV
jgi:hypothetical protein